ncbi:MAG: hypothetical protein KY440_08510 [Actinobacteria bacterium]|nr:hypothetical protein [Actinomycetota bacterium]
MPAGRARRSAALWALATPAVVLLAACLPLIGTHDFYFWDDTEIGGFPLYFHLGELLRAGTWPVLDPGMWMGGNFLAEGQWGLWNPMILAIGVAASAANSAIVFTTLLKLVFLMAAALGAFLLARSYNVRPQLAFAAGVAVPLNGFTLYMDAPDWASGLMTWSMLPYAWLALRRSTAKNASPVAFLVVAYLIVTVGYVQGTIGLCLVLLAVGIDRLCARDWRAVQRVSLGAVFVVLLGITVYLPAMLSADVTLRSNDEVLNTGLLTADLGGLVSSGIPTAVFAVSGWWGEWTTTPMLYTTWFLPALAFVSWTRVRPQLAEVRDVAIVLLGAAMFVVGPSDAGALRYPMRFMPYVALAGIIGLLVLLDRSLSASTGRSALGGAIGLVLLGSYISYSQRPSVGGIMLWTILVMALGLLVVWLLVRRSGAPSRTATVGLALVLAAGSVLSVAAQTALYPASPTDHYDMPEQIEGYGKPLPVAVNDVLVIGQPSEIFNVTTTSRFDDDVTSDPDLTSAVAAKSRLADREPEPPRGDVSQLWDETLIANTWLINDASVMNVYSIIQHEAFADSLCMNHRGETCPDLLGWLFTRQRGVSTALVDLLSVDTLHLLKARVPEDKRKAPPLGWSVATDGQDSVTWTRDEPVGPAGGVVWTSRGTSVTELERTARTVRLKVDDVPAAGGQAVFSRLNWPGYSVTGGTLAEPVNDFLVAVDVPASTEGGTVELSFSPPGWTTVRASWALALVLGLGWSVTHLVLARRRRRRDADARAHFSCSA